MRIRVGVILDVEDCDPGKFVVGDSQAMNAAVEAVFNAVQHGEENGFDHNLAGHVAIAVVAVEPDKLEEHRGKVVVFVEGGVVTGCTSNDPRLEVVLVDRDNLLEEEDPEAAEDAILEGCPDCVHDVY